MFKEWKLTNDKKRTVIWFDNEPTQQHLVIVVRSFIDWNRLRKWIFSRFLRSFLPQTETNKQTCAQRAQSNEHFCVIFIDDNSSWIVALLYSWPVNRKFISFAVWRHRRRRIKNIHLHLLRPSEQNDKRWKIWIFHLLCFPFVYRSFYHHHHQQLNQFESQRNEMTNKKK